MVDEDHGTLESKLLKRRDEAKNNQGDNASSKRAVSRRKTKRINLSLQSDSGFNDVASQGQSARSVADMVPAPLKEHHLI